MIDGLIHISFASPFYEYNGRKFEMHRYCGPIELDDDLEEITEYDAGFYEDIESFLSLKDDERDRYRL